MPTPMVETILILISMKRAFFILFFSLFFNFGTSQIMSCQPYTFGINVGIFAAQTTIYRCCINATGLCGWLGETDYQNAKENGLLSRKGMLSNNNAILVTDLFSKKIDDKIMQDLKNIEISDSKINIDEKGNKTKIREGSYSIDEAGNVSLEIIKVN